MPKTLHIVVIEDNPFDLLRIDRELEMSGFEFQLARAQTENDLRRELDLSPPDLVLSDHGLPSFDGFTALRMVRKKFPQLPFIFVSGSNDQGMIIDMYDQGATDYVYKNDIAADLEVAVRRALTPVSFKDTKQLHLALPPEVLPPLLPPSIPAPRRVTRLRFCPNCQCSWDESGNPCRIENYCGTHEEVIVIRDRCVMCAQRAAS
jgi:CheY-like chemotaxis protein